MKTYIVKVDDYGTKRWYLDDKLHCEDGPAVEYADGTKLWYLNSNLHREDGPAVELPSGSKYWYLNDKLHCEDGPAVEYTNGTKRWFLNNKEYTEADWRKQSQKIKAPCVAKVVEIDGVKYKLVEA